MIRKLGSLIKNKSVENGIWLYVFQFFNLIVPFLTLPYITRTLGEGHYGIFSSALNFTTYFNVFVAYGFDLIGAKKASLINDEEELNSLYSHIFLIKTVLMLISFGLMSILSLVFHLPVDDYALMLVLFMIVVGSVFQQVWLFHGLQKMKIITIVNVLLKILSMVLIFVFVKNSDHLLLYAVLYASTFLLVGIICFMIALLELKIRFTKIEGVKIKENLKDALPTFFTSFAASLYSGIGVTVLTLFYDDNVVGGYSAIIKIPIIFVSLFTPFLQALFPYISKQYNESTKDGINTLTKMMKILMPIVLIATLVLIIFSRPIVNVLFGSEYVKGHYLLMPLSIWMLFGVLNNFLGIQGLVASGNQKFYSRAFLFGVIAVIVLSFSLGYFYESLGVALAIAISETVLTIACLYYLRKKVVLK